MGKERGRERERAGWREVGVREGGSRERGRGSRERERERGREGEGEHCVVLEEFGCPGLLFGLQRVAQAKVQPGPHALTHSHNPLYDKP